jgi:hypothetical protein
MCMDHVMLLEFFNQGDGVGWLSCEDDNLYIFWGGRYEEDHWYDFVMESAIEIDVKEAKCKGIDGS